MITDAEGHGHDPVDGNPHEAARFDVLGYRSHAQSRFRPINDKKQSQHQQKGHDRDDKRERQYPDFPHDNYFHKPFRALDFPGNGRKYHDRQVLEEKGHADGTDQRGNSWSVPQGSVRDAVHHDPCKGRDGYGNDDRKRPWQMEQGYPPEDKIGPQHEDFSVSEIDQTENPVDHGISDCD
jgi:hypothetical protein